MANQKNKSWLSNKCPRKTTLGILGAVQSNEIWKVTVWLIDKKRENVLVNLSYADKTATKHITKCVVVVVVKLI